MADALDFSGARVAVAGGSRGIGRAIALAFLARGAKVAVCARGAEGLAHLAADAGDAAARLVWQPVDLADGTAAAGWIDAAATAMDGLDVLVNNASGYGFADDDAHWLADFNVDLMAAVRATRAARPYLEHSSSAAVINVSSISALGPRPTGPAYAALKAALNSYTRSAAAALAPARIRVNAIAPGSIEFPGGVWDRCKHSDPAQYQAVLARIPFDRYGEPDDIANAALFLASPLAAWVTGQILVVDGGQSLTG